MSTRQDYITAIGNLVSGDLPLGEAEKIFAISAAVKKYSGHRPLIIAEDEDGNGSFDYALTLLESWTDGFSEIRSVEYPVDDTSEAANTLDDDDWAIYQKPEGKCLRFLADTPSATEDIRITYTALHTCTDAACTIPANDEEALQILAAGIFCEMIAAYYAQTQDSTIMADSVNHKSKAAEYASRAKRFALLYKEHLGLKEDDLTPAAAAVADLDMKYPGGMERLTHPRRQRVKR